MECGRATGGGNMECGRATGGGNMECGRATGGAWSGRSAACSASCGINI